jgi:MraZ protein
MMLFTGSYQRALDDKQRLPLPKPVRDALEAGARLYLTPGLDGCLALYPEAAFASLGDRLAATSPASREVRDYSRLFYSQAACVVPDGQWRFRIPAELTKWAGLDGEVMIVGVRDHLEIWSIPKWHQYVARCDPQYDQLAEVAFVTAASGRPLPPGERPNDSATSSAMQVPTQPR